MHIRPSSVAILAFLFASWCVPTAQAQQGSSFVYQGELNNGGQPVTSLADVQFRLFDAATGGNLIGSMQQASGIQVTSGRFSASIDFGAAAFQGQQRWVEIAVRSPAGSGPFTTLLPRQKVTSVPYATYSLNADTLGGQPQRHGPATYCHLSLQVSTLNLTMERRTNIYFQRRLASGGSGLT